MTTASQINQAANEKKALLVLWMMLSEGVWQISQHRQQRSYCRQVWIHPIAHTSRSVCIYLTVCIHVCVGTPAQLPILNIGIS